MKIKSLKLKNFAKFTDFECDFDGKITRLVGVNGSGKSTVGLYAIWAAIKGISEKSKDNQLVAERFRFIGKNGKSADAEICVTDTVLNADIYIRNHITKQSNHITFEYPDNYPMTQEWVNDLLSVAFLSAKNFSQLKSKDQALLLGINTDEFDSEIKDLKQEYTLLNRQLKAFGDISVPEKVERVSVTELLTLKEEYEEFNRKQKQVGAIKDNIAVEAADKKAQIKEMEESIKALKQGIKDKNIELSSMPDAEPDKDIGGIVEKIGNAERINAEAQKCEHSERQLIMKKEKQEELDENREQQEKYAKQRLDYVKSYKFGVEGLEVDEAGGLLLDGRPIKEPYFSKGELEMIIAKLHASQNPSLKVRFIDDFELLDEANQQKLLDDLFAEGFQVITAEVGDKATKENTIVLRECEKVEE